MDPLQGTDAHQLPYPNASFTVVMLVRTLAHLHDPAQALLEAQRVLAPGGQLIVASHGPQHLAELLGQGVPLEMPHVAQLAAEAFAVVQPVVLDVAVQRALLESYGLERAVQGELPSRLHLAGWVYADMS